MARRPPPDRFDEWLDFGRQVISRARDDHELQHVEAWAEILSIEARVERLSRVNAPPPPTEPPEEYGPAMSAAECAHASGWRAGQVVRRGYSPRWFYDHWDELPFAIRPQQGRTRRFASGGFLRWLAAHKR